MHRWTSSFSVARRLLLAGVLAAGAGLAAAQGVVPNEPRIFPVETQFAELTITDFPEVAINGQTIRTTPGFRLFTPDRTLVMAHNLQGQKFPVAFVIEPSTQWLHTAWILSPSEIEQYQPVKPSLLRRMFGL